MKSLAELKRRIKVGTRLRVVDHWIERYRGTERVVTKVYAGSYDFDFNGETHNSPWMKRSETTFTGPNSYRIQGKRPEKYWELEIVEEGS